MGLLRALGCWKRAIQVQRFRAEKQIGYTWTVHGKYIFVPKKGIFEIECRFMCKDYSEIEHRL